LVVDDEEYVRDSLGEMLQGEGFSVSLAHDASSALRVLDEEPVDVVVTDLRMPGGDGLELLTSTSARNIPVPVIMITGAGTVGDAVAAMKAGAFDLVQKPVDPEELCLLVTRAVEHRGLVGEVRRLRDTLSEMRGQLVGGSPAMETVRAAIESVAISDATVLVVGESGTGKGLVAEAVHAASPRAAGAFVRVHCAAIPAELFVSELFGHKQGAVAGAQADRIGRFEEAQGGTLVLDEVGLLGPDAQVKLLHALDTREIQRVGEARTRVVDARIVAVTNEDLAQRVEEGTFRSDLLYRLNVFPIVVPPLRDRVEDLSELCAHLLERARVPGAQPATLAEDVIDVLGSYAWPGNVRELRNVVERAAIVAGEGAIDASTIRTILESTLAPARQEPQELALRRNLDAREKELILAALLRTEGRKGEAAELLGVDPRNFGYYLRKHGLAEGGGGRRSRK
jgi:DNA-binding NtrC family response regulator